MHELPKAKYNKNMFVFKKKVLNFWPITIPITAKICNSSKTFTISKGCDKKQIMKIKRKQPNIPKEISCGFYCSLLFVLALVGVNVWQQWQYGRYGTVVE